MITIIFALVFPKTYLPQASIPAPIKCIKQKIKKRIESFLLTCDFLKGGYARQPTGLVYVLRSLGELVQPTEA